MLTIKIQITEVSSVLDHCRKLLAEGVDPNTTLEAYRGETLCLRIPKIGDGGKWTIRENNRRGPEFRKYEPYPLEK